MHKFTFWQDVGPMNLLVSMRYLVALDEHKHFARAAQACFVTQPALSNAIRALEEEFGSSIVKRGRTSYHLRMRGGVLRVPFAWVERA